MRTTKHGNTTVGRHPSLRAGSIMLGATVCFMGMAILSGCRSSESPSTRATIIDNNPSGADPADANLAPVGTPVQPVTSRPAGVRVLGTQQSYAPQQSVEQYPQQQASPNDSAGNQPNYDNQVNAGYDALEDASQPPPPLPVYEQPPAPEPNDLWTPGYWNYAPQGYFWVPGAWVAAPYAGALWTPGYWGYQGNFYRFHRGFWARHIGFYGGVNYGFGYTGTGYRGGYWNGDNFYYNRAVNRVNVTNIHNVYERTVVVNNVTRISYNGGNGGIQARPGPQELAVLHEQRTPAMSTQIQLRQESAQNRQQFFNQNHGQPAQPVAARPIPAERTLQPPPAFQQQHVQDQRPIQQTQQQDQRQAHEQQLQRTQQADSQARQNALQTQQRQQQDQQQRNALQAQQNQLHDQQQRNAQSQQEQAHQQQAQQQQIRQQQAQQQHLQDQQRQPAQQQRAIQPQNEPQRTPAPQQPPRPFQQQPSPRPEPMQHPQPQAQPQQPRSQPEPHNQPAPQQSQPHTQAAPAPHPQPAPAARPQK